VTVVVVLFPDLGFDLGDELANVFGQGRHGPGIVLPERGRSPEARLFSAALNPSAGLPAGMARA
jgi:hypothetical protein